MRRVAAIALAFAGASLPSFAAGPPSLFLEQLTWTEVRDAVAAGKTTILVPIGGTEQNGPHMALGKHNARATELARRIAQGLGDALVAPTIAYVPEGAIEPPAAHMKYAGTISIPEEAFEKTLEGAARSFRHAGFRKIVFLGDHGGYLRSLKRVAARLDAQWAPAVHVLVPSEYYEELPHAGRADTSLTLGAGLGGMVRTDRVNPKATGLGAAQDPSGADEKAGVAVAQQIVDRTVASLKKGTGPR
jgi:creatinine amidohydrolase